MQARWAAQNFAGLSNAALPTETEMLQSIKQCEEDRKERSHRNYFSYKLYQHPYVGML
jgi:hypothetical protein